MAEFDPKSAAKSLLDSWMVETGIRDLLNRRSPVLRDLESRVERLIGRAYKKGARDQLQLSKDLKKTLDEPSAARQILPPHPTSKREVLCPNCETQFDAYIPKEGCCPCCGDIYLWNKVGGHLWPVWKGCRE